MGIEPTRSAWKAEVLPLNYTRSAIYFLQIHDIGDRGRVFVSRRCAKKYSLIEVILLVEGEGFEPPKAEPSDLQSDPFGRSGTPPSEDARFCPRH